jgi:PAS domain S-box-containing protein
MSMQFTLYLIPLIAATAVSAALAIYAWRHHRTPGAIPFMILMIALVEWGFFYILELTAIDLPLKNLFNKATFLGVVSTPTAWLIFALEYTSGKTWLNRRRLALLAIMPVLTMVMILTNDLHRLFWVTRDVVTVGPFLVLDSLYGAGFWIHAVYSYVLLLLGAVLIVRNILRWPLRYRGQIAAVLLALSAPWLANAVTIFKILPIAIDLTPFAFTITGLGMAYALFRHRMLDLVPIARDVVIDSMKDGMIVIDAANRIVDINREAKAILGLSGKHGLIGKPLEDSLEEYKHLYDRYRNVTEAEEEIVIEHDGKPYWYEFNLSPLRDSQGQLIGQLIIARDITSRKQAELLLQESETRFRQIVENASDCIFRTDAIGNFTYANPAALHTMGFSSESQVLGTHYLELVAPGARLRSKRIYQRQFLKRITNQYSEVPAITEDGCEIWFGQNVQLITDGEKVTGFQVLARDITAIKQAQESLRLAHDQALEASRVKSQLLSKVSHELRTPLGGILGYSELLQNDSYGLLNSEQKQAIGEIILSVNYLTNMVGELLDEAQIQANKTILQVKRFSPRRLLRQAITGMNILAQKKGLKFEASIDPNLPQELLGDERRLLQIMINLIGNAIKFTQLGFVTVRIACPDDRYWSIEVTDSGIGIAKEYQARIFEPFQQADKALSPHNRGIGLGLSITKQLVDLMGGRIVLESEFEKGSAFKIFLPILKPSDDPDLAQVELSRNM